MRLCRQRRILSVFQGRPGKNRPEKLVAKIERFRRQSLSILLMRYAASSVTPISVSSLRLLSGTSPHQRWLADSIKQARNIALIPFGSSM